ncbi:MULTISPECIES: hypothetical protein [unclassified Fusibacter]|uniref:hypothetical protein n=1 Tax=unclassified Fusibacter TaxID=2624464 RepID=UPI001011EED1|nr:MULTISPECIES: hypothetical protein [unclassified Fusibacter]MCK8059425.1 hypothetical protein [Fusibacter sp. A2]NPE21111.1 hypothetical protein [Fusibacter sp. A1]RXV62381.1 hypothetical protein DWB64_04695 [Fusibacter sp. A1]
MTTVMGIKVGNREEEALKVQELLSTHGCIIKTRLGVHEAGNMCSSTGLILIEFVADKEVEINKLKAELEVLTSVKVGVMTL